MQYVVLRYAPIHERVKQLQVELDATFINAPTFSECRNERACDDVGVVPDQREVKESAGRSDPERHIHSPPSARAVWSPQVIARTGRLS